MCLHSRYKMSKSPVSAWIALGNRWCTDYALSPPLSPRVSFFYRFLSKKTTDFPQKLWYLLAVNWITINVWLGDCWGRKEGREEPGQTSKFSQLHCANRRSTPYILSSCFWLNCLGWILFFFFPILETVTKCHAKKKERCLHSKDCSAEVMSDITAMKWSSKKLVASSQHLFTLHRQSSWIKKRSHFVTKTHEPWRDLIFVAYFHLGKP